MSAPTRRRGRGAAPGDAPLAAQREGLLVRPMRYVTEIALDQVGLECGHWVPRDWEPVPEFVRCRTCAESAP